MAPWNAFIVPTNYILSTGLGEIYWAVERVRGKLYRSIDSRVLEATTVNVSRWG